MQHATYPVNVSPVGPTLPLYPQGIGERVLSHLTRLLFAPVPQELSREREAQLDRLHLAAGPGLGGVYAWEAAVFKYDRVRDDVLCREAA